jgi:hypothetical protein
VLEAVGLLFPYPITAVRATSAGRIPPMLRPPAWKLLQDLELHSFLTRSMASGQPGQTHARADASARRQHEGEIGLAEQAISSGLEVFRQV